jgi:glycosyltransferase involved in cell wall biosynthesis
MTHATPELSVVIPFYNESGNIAPLYDELGAILAAMGRPYEVILVDDGSRDATFAELRALHQRDGRWRVIRLRRNFGQTAAMRAGFDAATGRYIITIDGDLQNDPNDIPKLLARLENEALDIISGWRKNRQEAFWSRRLPSQLANGLISRTTGVHLHDYGCSLKIYRAEVIKQVRIYGELHRFLPALASSIGVIVGEEAVNDRRRRFGKSKYGLGRTLRVTLDLIGVLFILRYFQKPLQVFGLVGVLMGGVGVLLGLYLSYIRLFLGQSIGDRPLLLLAVMLVIIGVQMVSLGLVAEMVMRTYFESQNKPAYYVRERLE